MYAPGPPRFVAVGESIELAPRDPDPAASDQYRWTLTDAPEDSRVGLDETPVIQFAPDQPGRYRLELETPGKTYTQTVRAFPSCLAETTIELAIEELPSDLDSFDSISVVGPFNDQLVGRDRPERRGDRLVLDVALPPGEHVYGFCLDDDFSQQIHGSVTVPGPGRPRCHLDGRIEGDTLVVTATATAAPDSDHADDELTVEFIVDDRDRDHVVDEAIDRDERSLRIPIAALSDRLRIHAVAVGERRSVADTLDVRASSDNAAAGTDDTAETATLIDIHRPNDPPAWAESPTIYEIFVRSFAGETPPTTFEAIERRVEYLESLAIDVLWLTPVLESPTTHGYHITDYFTTATDLGSRADFESLIERCHEAGIKVVFDLVINHTSRDHPAFQFHASGVEGYEDYYNRVPRERDGTGVEWAGDDSPEFYFNWQRIPNLNYESLAVRRWMLDVVDEWASVVDGFRCDVAWGVSHCFWKEVSERVPDDFLLLDETIPRDPLYHESEFQMHYDTSLYGTLREIGHGNKPASAIFAALDDARWQGFPESAVHLRYVENHDETRYLAECDEATLRAAVGAIFTLPGAPMIYYGQEQAMTEDRGPMKWYNGDRELVEFHRSLSHLRRAQPVLKTGAVEPLSVSVVTDSAATLKQTAGEVVSAAERQSSDEPTPAASPVTTTNDPDHVVAFARDDGDDRLLIVLNFAHEPQTVSLSEPVGSTNLLTGQPLRKRYDQTEGTNPHPADHDATETFVVVEDVIVCWTG